MNVLGKGISERALKTFGLDKQMIKCIEELSELQKELCKYSLGQGNLEHTIEEIADVEIMLEQMKLGMDIGFYELNAAKDKKLCRLRDRLNVVLEAEKPLRNEPKCRDCQYSFMTEQDLAKIGIDPYGMCRNACNWKFKYPKGVSV